MHIFATVELGTEETFLEGFMYLHNHLIKEKFLGLRGQSSVAFLGLP